MTPGGEGTDLAERRDSVSVWLASVLKSYSLTAQTYSNMFRPAPTVQRLLASTFILQRCTANETGSHEFTYATGC